MHWYANGTLRPEKADGFVYGLQEVNENIVASREVIRAAWASFESWLWPSSNSQRYCPRLESNKGPQNYEFCALTS